MNVGLEFHDSSVANVRLVGTELRVSFDEAYLHHSLGRPGIEPGKGYVQSAELLFGNARYDGSLDVCRGQLSDGRLLVNGDQVLFHLRQTATF